MRPFIKFIFLFCAAQSMILGEEWNIVHLASFPRSGNHWVRFLVEEATHITTSSVYCDGDFPHLQKIFPWGGFCTDHGYNGDCRYPEKDDPVFLKTHYPYLKNGIYQNPKNTVCLIRHPIDAFWSLNVYMKNIKSRQIDQKLLKRFVQGWGEFYEFWLRQPDVLFVRYEDLHADTPFYLSLILEKAGFSFNQIDIERAVNKYLPKEKPLKHINHYNVKAVEMIRTELADILVKFNYEI